MDQYQSMARGLGTPDINYVEAEESGASEAKERKCSKQERLR